MKINTIIGNKNTDEFILSCIKCGGLHALTPIAMRNSRNHVTGIVYSCSNCIDKVQDTNMEMVER